MMTFQRDAAFFDVFSSFMAIPMPLFCSLRTVPNGMIVHITTNHLRNVTIFGSGSMYVMPSKSDVLLIVKCWVICGGTRNPFFPSDLANDLYVCV